MQVIRPQMRGNMHGALVRDDAGIIRELPAELPDAARALDRIASTARQMAGAIVTEGGSARFAERHAAAIEADVALLRQTI